MNKCSNCGAEYNGKFCPECGAPAESKRHCQNCGAELDVGVKFCPECGASLVSQGAAPVGSPQGGKSVATKITAVMPACLLALFSVLCWAFFAAPAADFFVAKGTIYELYKEELSDSITNMSLALMIMAAIGCTYSVIFVLCSFARKGDKSQKLIMTVLSIIIMLLAFIFAILLANAIKSEEGKVCSATTLIMVFSIISILGSVVCEALNRTKLKQDAVVGKRIVLSAKGITNAFNKFGGWIKKHLKAFIAITVSVVVVAVTLGVVLGVVVPYYKNNFRAEKVEKIHLGDSKSKVVKVLGEADIKQEFKFEYFDKDYAKLIKQAESLKDKIEETESFEELAELNDQYIELNEKLNSKRHKYIRVDFDSSGKVCELLLDMKYCKKDESREKTGSEVSIDPIPFFIDEETYKVAFSVKYSDGSFRRGYISMDNATMYLPNYAISWKDEYGAHSTIIKTKFIKDYKPTGFAGDISYTADITKDDDDSYNISVEFSGNGHLEYNKSLNDVKSYITEVTLQPGITYIGSKMFFGWDKLTNITIPDSVTSIGSAVFADTIGYAKLENVTIPAVAMQAVSSKNLKTAVITSGNTIESRAFYGCSSLTSITICNDITYVGADAFEGCNSLQYNEYDNAYYLGNAENPYVCLIKAKSTDITSCNINKNTKAICTNAFEGCNSLQYNEYDNAYYLGNAENPYVCLVKAKSTNITSCNINENTKIIYREAFKGCRSLTSIDISNGVTSIWDSAFSGCDSLQSITIPDSVTSIGGGAFYNCSNLQSITIPDSVTSIGNYAFYNCSSLQNITIPDRVTSIGEGAFCRCGGLTSVSI